MELHDQIRVARERLGWDQRQLAKAMNVSLTTVDNWEKHGAMPRPERLRELERILHTTLYATGTPQPTATGGFSADEVRLLLAISRLPLAIRKAIEALVEFKALAATSPKRPHKEFEVTKPRRTPEATAEFVKPQKGKGKENHGRSSHPTRRTAPGERGK